jgi:DNA polymerase-3 subunit alpha
MCDYAPLHNHTHYSALDGISTPLEIVQRCQEIGVGAAGITDHGVVSGHIEFDRVMRQNGLRPILGMEAYHGLIPGKPEPTAKVPGGKKTATRDQHHFIVLAGTDEGLKNIWRLSDSAAENSHFVPRMTWDTMKRYSEGVWATSSCISGVLAQGVLERVDFDPYEAVNRYLDTYGDRFYIELHVYPDDDHEKLNWELVNIATEKGIGVVYATDAHFAFPDQYDLHDLYVCMQTGDVIWTDPNDRKMWHPLSLFIQDEKQIRESLSYLPESVVDEALANSAYIASQCDAHLPEVRPHLPVFIPKDCPYTTPEQKEMTPEELFLDLIEKGIKWRYPNADKSIWERATYEANVFLEAGLEHYFLYNWDIGMYCDDKGILRGAGRGSAPGAITAFALNITDICPIHYGLYFERFWNPGRAKGFPDIDSDYPRGRRAEIRKYSEERLGLDKVYSIGTITRLKPKTALDRTAKAFAIKGTEVEQVKKIIAEVPDIDILDVDSIGWDPEIDPGVFQGLDPETGEMRFQRKEHYVTDHVGADLDEWLAKQPESRQEILEEWLDTVSNLCSRISGYGVHPSGVVLSDCTLSDELPAMWNSGKKIKVTQFPMDIVDKRSFLKNDYLGLRNLDTLEEWERRVAKHGIKIDWSGLEREEFPAEMWKLPERGFTMGLFQVEDHYGARKLCKDIKPKCVEDCSMIVGLNNPGPQRSGAAEAFVRRRNGLEEAVAEHPILDDILAETLGVIIYQEQIIRFALKLGYSAGDADAIRKMLGKKDPQAMRDFQNGEGAWKGKGYFQATEAAGIPQATAQSLIEKINLFALYSFNKAHSMCYGTLFFRTLFAKYYAPAEFFISCIKTVNDTEDGSKDPNAVAKTALLISEARRMDISILPPDIMLSQADIEVAEDGNIYFGFTNIKGIAAKTAKNLIALRDEVGDAMMTPGGYADIMDARQLDWNTEKKAAKKDGKEFTIKSPRSRLNTGKDALFYAAGCFTRYEDSVLTPQQRQAAEEELLGVVLTDSSSPIFARNQDLLEECDDWEEFMEDPEFTKAVLPATITNIRRTKVRKTGADMAILTLEYGGWSHEFAMFSQVWKAYRTILKDYATVICKVTKNDRGMAVDKVTILK